MSLHIRKRALESEKILYGDTSQGAGKANLAREKSAFTTLLKLQPENFQSKLAYKHYIENRWESKIRHQSQFKKRAIQIWEHADIEYDKRHEGLISRLMPDVIKSVEARVKTMFGKKVTSGIARVEEI